MSSCVVKIDSQEYDGEYEIEDRKAKVSRLFLRLVTYHWTS